MSAEKKPRLCRVAGRETWHIYYEGRRSSTGCTDRTEAESVLARFIADQDLPKLRAQGVRGILEGYVADRKDAGKPGAERLAWACKPLIAWFGEGPADGINAAQVRAYARHRQSEGISTGTARTEAQALRAALRWAVKEKLITDCPDVPLPPRSAPRERWLTRTEAQALLDGCVGLHVRLFVALALGTGARAGALLDLKWDRVDMGARIIDLRDPGRARTSKGRARVPINDDLFAALQTAQANRETAYVVEWAGGRVASIKNAFRAAVKRAGLEDVTPHTLRHTAATWMAQAGVPLWEIAGVLGHSDTRMIEATYAHHSPDYLRSATCHLNLQQRPVDQTMFNAAATRRNP